MFDPDQPTLKARLASGPCMAVSWLALGSPALVEAAARAAPDAIVIDMQHGLWERRDLEAAIGIVPHRIPVIVRVAENSALAISAALDAGAEGVMVPMIENADEGRQAIRSAKYPPHGTRSAGGVRPLQDFAAYLRGAGEIAVMLMIETAQGLANAEDIARLEGLDMVFIGTGDLALSLRILPGDTARHAAACEQILHACRAASIACGSFTTSIEAAQQRRQQGYGMVVAVNDIDLMTRGFAEASARLREHS
ncbi:MAG TPA: aldolase/citrate lyase family protein [Variovorax sp.]